MAKSVKAKLELQQRKIQEANDALEKIKMNEAKRLLAIYDEEGYFEVDVSDEALRASVAELVKKSAGSPQTASTSRKPETVT